jgi:hypothetical protein
VTRGLRFMYLFVYGFLYFVEHIRLAWGNFGACDLHNIALSNLISEVDPMWATDRCAIWWNFSLITRGCGSECRRLDGEMMSGDV